MNTLLHDVLNQWGAGSFDGLSPAGQAHLQAVLQAYSDLGVLAEELTVFLDSTPWEDSKKGSVWHAFARLLGRQNQLDTAGRFYEAGLAWSPENTDMLSSLGFVRYNLGLLDLAQASFETLLQREPKWFNAYMGLGMVKRRQGQLEEAILHYDAAIQINPKAFEAWLNRGNALRQLNRMEDAYRSYEKSVQLKPGYLPGLKGQIAVLKDTDQPTPAIPLLIQALNIVPQDRELLMDRAWACQMTQDYEQAARIYQYLLQKDPNCIEALQGLGNTAFRAGETPKSIDYYRQVVARIQDSTSYHNLGVALTRTQQYEEALVAHERAFALKPDYLSAHVNHSLLHMLMGNLPQGLPEYEWRLKAPFYLAREIACTPWQGESLAGKTLLILTEQGFGDAFMYLRHVAQLKAQGATVVFECRPELWSLMENCPDIDTLVPCGVWEQRELPYDYYCYLVSLPYLLKTTLETIPLNRPEQFVVSPQRQQHWRDRFASVSELKIGITWASKADHPNAGVRSCPLTEFIPLAETAGVRFYSFQKGDDPAARTPWPAGKAPLEDLGPDLNDFADTVAAVACMDLVITVDTAVAHVAASLNIPTWVALPLECDWRWFVGREDSPWYPSLRLFRQPTFGDWESTFNRIKGELKQYQPVSLV